MVASWVIAVVGFVYNCHGHGVVWQIFSFAPWSAINHTAIGTIDGDIINSDSFCCETKHTVGF
jgi:hypothetical protein